MRWLTTYQEHELPLIRRSESLTHAYQECQRSRVMLTGETATFGCLHAACGRCESALLSYWLRNIRVGGRSLTLLNVRCLIDDTRRVTRLLQHLKDALAHE